MKRSLLVLFGLQLVVCVPRFSLCASSDAQLSFLPLAEPSEGHNGRLFELIDQSESRIDFENTYNHPERWTRLWHQYFLGTIGTGVALGDVNGDGFADIYAVGKDSPNALYLNNGDFTFTDVTEKGGVAGKEGIGAGVSMVDIDNDGDLDIYVTYTGFANELYINDGQGVFTEQAAQWGLDTNTGSNAPSFADYDRDGDLDLYLQCNFLTESGLAEGMPDLMFENLGNRFVEVTAEAGIEGHGQGHAAIWWDYNEDGWPDIYIANDFEPADKLYRNNGDGTFADVIEETLISAPYSAMGADLGDINNDGHVDFLVSEMATRDPVKHQRTVGMINFKLLRAPTNAVSQYMKNMLSVKVGTSQFVEVAYLANLHATDWTWAARLVDLDNDGWLDAYFTNGMARAFHDGDIGHRSLNVTGAQRMAYYKASPQYDEQNLAFRNDRNLRFSDVSEEWGLDHIGVSFAAAFADFDLDGDLDLVVSNLSSNLSLYRNNSVAGNRVTFRLEGQQSNRYGVGAKLRIKAGDVLQTREMTLTRGYLSTDEPIAHFGLGAADSVDRIEIEWPSGVRQSLVDIKAGRRYVIRESQANAELELAAGPATLFTPADIHIPKESVTREEYYQMFPREMHIPFVETRRGPPMAVEDLDDDGWKDVVLGGPTGQETRVFRNKEGRRLELVESDAFEDDFDSEDRSIVVGDFDSDGISDLLVTSGSVELDEGDVYYKDRIYLNYGELAFGRLGEDAFAPSAIASDASVLLDVDGDGDLDWLIGGGTRKGRYPDHEDNQVWLKEGGTFVRDEAGPFAESFSRSGRTNALLKVDLDGDGDLDLVQALEWGVPRFWYNSGDTLVEKDVLGQSDAYSGIWRSLACGDFNEDGRVDIVIGGIGQNTHYRPSRESPNVLLSPGNAYLENTYIEAYTVDGRLVPVESKNLHEHQFPKLMDTTSDSVEAFSKMTIEEIFPEKLLSQYERFRMTETRSMILYQNESGKFDPTPLPHEAQSGIAGSLLVADFNEDGRDDILIAHEMHPPKVWADRNLRGHLTVLLNHGDRGFKTLWPWKSGLATHGYPRSLAWEDLDNDGQPELLVAMNGGPLLIFSRNK